MTIPDEILRVRIAAPGPGGTVASTFDYAAITQRLDALEAITLPPRQAILGGRFYGPLSSISGPLGTNTLNAEPNRLSAGVFICPQNAAFSEIGLVVTTAAGSGGTIRFGLYDTLANGLPANLVTEMGVVDVTASGYRALGVSETIPRGLYWLAGAPNAAVTYEVVTVTLGVTAVLGHADTSGASPRAGLYRSALLTDGFTALPSSFGGVNTTYYIPNFWLKAV